MNEYSIIDIRFFRVFQLHVVFEYTGDSINDNNNKEH